MTSLGNNSITLLKATMNNTAFMDFVEQEGGDRLAADVEAFFTEYTGENVDVLFDRLRPKTISRMWRFFVAYTLELTPYSPLCTHLLENYLNGKWDRLGLLALKEQKNHETNQQLCA
ncbi:hypothetical protein [Marinomonas fungiae]|uniref:hypothetical protein n=1 Tax=Marinomonas fungiae TaxID=1137284 RepID=UPI003A9057C9